MATKELKNIEVTLIGCGDAVTLSASDTATDPNATYALDDFKAEKYMTLKDRENEGVTNYVPFHAVDHIYVSESETSVADRPNPYGCEGGSDKGEVWAYADGIEIEAEIEEDGSISGETLVQRNYSAWKDLFDNPQNYEIEVKSDGKVASLVKTSEEEWEGSQDGLRASITKDSSYIGIGANDADATRIEIIVAKK